MKDPKDAARDLRNIYDMKFKMQLHANGFLLSRDAAACEGGMS